MKLSNLSWLTPMIHQNGEFFTMGHLLGHEKCRIVPISLLEDIPYCLENEDITGVIIPEGLLPFITKNIGVILSQNPVLTALTIQDQIDQVKHLEVSKDNIIHHTNNIHQSADIANHVTIGKRVTISEYVVIGEGTMIGDDIFIGPNTHIGTVPKIPECSQEEISPLVRGTTIIGNQTYIQSNCIIERPLFSDITCIGSRCHIDSQTIIHQGVRIGNSTLLAALVEVGEYSTIGDECWAGPRSKIEQGVFIGDACYITLGSLVTKNIKPGMLIRDNWTVRKERFKGIIP